MQTTGTHIATLSYPKAESKNIFSCSHQIEQMWKFSKPGHEIAEFPAGSHLMRKYHLHIYMVAVPKRNISYSQCCMMPEVHWLIKQILHSSPQKKYSSVPILNIFLVNQNKSCLLLYSSTTLNYRLACDLHVTSKCNGFRIPQLISTTFYIDGQKMIPLFLQDFLQHLPIHDQNTFQ